jgi:SAM-dependent methyltransferase
MADRQAGVRAVQETSAANSKGTLSAENSPGLAREVDRINERYRARESDATVIARWSPFQELEVAARCQQYRSLADFMRGRGFLSLAGQKILDVGCGTGRQPRMFLEYGAAPADVYGLEIRDSVLEVGRQLSPHLSLTGFDGHTIPFPDNSFGLVTQYVVFSSIGSPPLRRRLASEMWRVVAPGGFIYWWDLTVMQGPAGDECGTPLRLHELFPGVPSHERRIAPYPRPDECARPSTLSRLLAPLLRRLGHKPTHVAALLGPK